MAFGVHVPVLTASGKKGRKLTLDFWLEAMHRIGIQNYFSRLLLLFELSNTKGFHTISTEFYLRFSKGGFELMARAVD